MVEHEMTPLCELARKYQTDKGGWHLQAGETCHNYTPFYYRFWKDRRLEVMNVLEIGVNYCCSLRMWEEFFPNAHIYGIDSNADCLQYNGPRIHVHMADQGSVESLHHALHEMKNPLFDFIVDDGSHETHHQILSCNCLMPSLKKDGLYVIEDIVLDCQPESVGKFIHYPWIAVPTGHGLGKAHCWEACRKCHGKEGEQLICVAHEGKPYLRSD
ncbi:MAG TPA: hypothetical protein VFK47_20855 [Ktedonobacteraceae bacterium]|nr:hypothetical protein [Ktedonobacteraceae bacterium]